VARILSILLTMAVLFGVAYLALSGYGAGAAGARLTIFVGFVLLAASLGGSLAVRLRLPRITGFILVGMVAGPSVLGLVPSTAVADLRLIDRFALALIAMLAGGELELRRLRRSGGTILFTTLVVVGVVTVGIVGVVLALSPLLPFLDGVSLPGILAMGLLLGIWASNSSPDLTVAVIEEVGAKGPLTDVILGVTIVKDVVVIVLFTVALALVRPLLGGGGGEVALLSGLAREVGGALLLGAVLGWIFSLYLQQQGRPPAFATFLFAYVLALAADLLHVELLLMGVAAGFVIENLSPAGEELIRTIESVAVVLFAFFFSIAGASLDLAAVWRFWLPALVFLVARGGLTYWGARKGTLLGGAPSPIPERTWKGLISQGGVTLGLLLVMAEALPGMGEGVVALGMAVIMGNILAGPIFLKVALAGAPGMGEGSSRLRRVDGEKGADTAGVGSTGDSDAGDHGTHPAQTEG